MTEQRAPLIKPGSDPEEKRKREIDDLRLVFSSLLDDKELEQTEKALYKYVSPDLAKIQDSFKPKKLEVFKDFPLTLEPGAPVLMGGGGVVVRCANANQRTLKYALKIPRPSLFVGGRASAKYFEAVQEYLMHAPLSHENIARVLAPGKMTIPNLEGKAPNLFDVILMEWIDGAKPLNWYLAHSDINYRTVVGLLTQAFKALEYLHSRHLIHWDIKSDNLLVSENGTLKLTDIGNARRDDDPARELIAHSTRGNPPTLLRSEESPNGSGLFTSRRVSIRLPHLGWDCPWLDLWMFARELNRLFVAVDELFKEDLKNAGDQAAKCAKQANEFLERRFPQDDDNAVFALTFLRAIIQRLLLPKVPTDAKCYERADGVIHDLSKLLPEFGGAQPVSELQAIPQRVLRLPRSGNAPWTKRISRLFNEKALQRLRRHKQLGAVSQVYPGATHTRLEHVAGVVATVSQYVRALYADRTDPFWRISVNSKDIDALILGALIHDVGHMAFGHFIEEMHGLVEGRSHEDYAILVLDPEYSGMVRFGEVNRRAALVDREMLKNVILTHWGVPAKELDSFLRYVAQILRPVEAACVCTRQEGRHLPQDSVRLKLEILHSILDSAIDADKLDYLLRDAHHCGVHYADGIDVDRFFQSLTAIPFLPKSAVNERPREDVVGSAQIKPVPHASIGVTDKGVLPVESLLIARYQMFSCVYWHHTTRAQTAMLQYLVLSYLEAGRSKVEVELRLDELIEKFRNSDDEKAVLWLRAKLVNQKRLEGGRKQLFENIADGVLGKDRDLLYWTAFELLYERGPRGTAGRIYDGLMSYSEDGATQKSPAAYVEFHRAIRENFDKLFVQRLGNRVEFTDGEVLIDIPPSRKDQVDNVFVNENDEIHPIQELSPLADAVSEAFRYWVRKPRVFLAPSAWRKVKAQRLTDLEVWRACFEALDELVMRQRPLKITRFLQLD